MDQFDCALDVSGKPVGDIDHIAHVGRLDHVLMIGVTVAKMKHELDIGWNAIGRTSSSAQGSLPPCLTQGLWMSIAT